MLSKSRFEIKSEYDDSSGEIDLARGRFESALQELLHKDETSDSENESDSDSKTRMFSGIHTAVGNTGNVCHNASSKPQRKRRRKEVEIRDSGFHHTFVMRMFDRSVDLAQFNDNSPLYPICRAWMINQPHNSSLNVKPEPSSPSEDITFMNDTTQESDASDVIGEILPTSINSLPSPEPWPENFTDPRTTKPLSLEENKLKYINEAENVSHSDLLSEHLENWKHIRNTWRFAAQVADSRYNQSYTILKAMFDKAHEL